MKLHTEQRSTPTLNFYDIFGRIYITTCSKLNTFPHASHDSTIGLYGIWILAEAIVENISNSAARTVGSIWHPVVLLTKAEFFALFPGASLFPQRNCQANAYQLVKVIALQNDSITLQTVLLCMFRGVTSPQYFHQARKYRECGGCYTPNHLPSRKTWESSEKLRLFRKS